MIMEYKGAGLNKLRFTGHTQPWEQKKLGEVAECLDNRRKPLNATERKESPGDIPYYGAVSVVDHIGDYIFDEPIVLLGEDGVDFKNYLNKPIAQLVTGKSWVNNHAHVFRVNEKKLIDLSFMFQSLLSKDLTKQVTGGTRTKLTKSEAMKINLPLPSLPEQEKIGGFLSALDERLRVQSELVDLLALEYTGYSQRIFNQTLRFKDENGNQYPDWEQKKLGEVATFSRGKGLPKSELSKDGTVPCVHYGELFASPVDFEPVNRTNFTKDKNYSVAGDILMPSSDVTKDGLAKASVVKESGVILGGDINIVRLEEGNNSIFWAHQIKHYKREIIKKVTGTAVKHFYTKELAKIEYYRPSLPEQVKIGGFLSALSARIEAERALLAQYKEQKKAYLQKLLP